ncbi:hypothetical protein [Nocardia nova]|uniref:hypothetical protein n=1 Tax=Nocardia nova TaxID=37330 RepID=UPI0033C5F66C
MTVDINTTTLDQQRADWAVIDGRITVFAFADGSGGVDAARFDAERCEPGGFVFPEGVSLARARDLLPEYHSLWCAVSEQARVLPESTA